MSDSAIQLPKFNNPLTYSAGQDTVHYGRDSGGRDQENSVDEQAEIYQRVVTAYHYNDLGIYADRARTGGSTSHRKQINAMLNFLYERYPEIDDRKERLKVLAKPRCVLIVWRWNRAMRDRMMRSRTRLNLLVRGIVVHSLMGQPTTNNSMIDDIMDLLEGYSDEKLLDDIGGDTKRSLHLNAEKRDTDAEFRALNPNWPTNDGRYLGITATTPPIGFKAEWLLVSIRERQRSNSKPGSEKHYLQHWVPDGQGVAGSGWERAKRAWEMAIEGSSYTDIHEECHLFDYLNSYSNFFSNRIYTGDYQYGDVVYQDFVPAMLERKDFEAFQVIRAERAKKLAGEPMHPALEPRRVASPALLSGKVYCGVVPGEEHPTNFHTAKEYQSYRCVVHKNCGAKRCPFCEVSARALHEAVIDALFRDVLTRDNLRALTQPLNEAISTEAQHTQDQVATLKGQIKDMQGEIDLTLKLLREQARLQDGAQSASLLRTLSQQEKNLADLEARLRNAQHAQIGTRPQITDEMLEAYLVRVRATLTGSDVALARRLIDSLVVKIVVIGKRATIYYRFPLAEFPGLRTSAGGKGQGDRGVRKLNLMIIVVNLVLRIGH